MSTTLIILTLDSLTPSQKPFNLSATSSIINTPNRQHYAIRYKNKFYQHNHKNKILISYNFKVPHFKGKYIDVNGTCSCPQQQTAC